MNLIFYSPQSLPSIGGLQYVVHYWAEALSARGHKITIITDTPQTDTLHSSEDGATPSPSRGRVGEGVTPSSVSAGEGVTAELPLRLRVSACETQSVPGSTLRRASFFQQVRAMRTADKVIMFNVSLKGLPAVLLSGKPLYITHHTALWYENGPRPLRQRLKQWIANYLAKDNCACSTYIASLYKNCRVIHSPYRSDVFVPGNKERNPGSILFAGRLVSDKGVDLLIKACGLLKKEGLTFSLTVVGDGPDREKLEQLAMHHGLPLPGEASSGAAESEPQGGDSSKPGLQAPVIEVPGLQAPVTAPDPCVETRTRAEVCVETRTAADETHTMAVGSSSSHTGSPLKGESEGPAPTPHNLSTIQPVNSSTITFTGPLSQSSLSHQMQTHQVMVVPSRMEPMGMVVAEGLGSGCRMVVSNQGGMPEVGGPFCRYFESGSVDSLVDALRLQLLDPLPVDEALLQKHLARFTIQYSVDELEKWLMG